MMKSALIILLLVSFTIACTIYYQPHGKRGGAVVIKLPEDPEVKPMPDKKNLPGKVEELL